MITCIHGIIALQWTGCALENIQLRIIRKEYFRIEASYHGELIAECCKIAIENAVYQNW
jgi:hypothetical protein